MRRAAAVALATGALLIGMPVEAQITPPDQLPHQKLDCEIGAAPKWVRRPSARDIERAYPRAAAASRLDGHATLVCNVGEDGGMHDCAISEETPQGHGFAAATLELAPLFKVTSPRCKDGRPAHGGTLNIPIRWHIG